MHCADLDLASAEAVAAETGGIAHHLDVTDGAAVDALAQELFRDPRGVDLVFNNAGIGHAGRVQDTPLEDWRRVVEVNLMGVVHGVHAFVPRLLAQGRAAHVVNTASLAGLVAPAGMAPYATTKFAVVGLTESLDAELAGTGVRMSALCPGIIDTAIVRTSVIRGDLARRKDRTAAFYAKRGTSPDAVAEAALEAVLRRRTVQPVPAVEVGAQWRLKRAAPRASRALMVGLMRVLDRG